ncbi:hypothetical protein RLEG12_14510 [Rhizobium leguminosarum bv. trifolii CB782]|nr:hypothetical protein RLEG12_14510 [Rhizobium leguminosarum bv. trifolii CB782]
MHFSPPDAGNFNKITAMVWPEGSPLPVSDGSGLDSTQPDFLQR